MSEKTKSTAGPPPRIELPYRADGADWFGRFRHWPGAVWLDSGGTGWDICAARPRVTLTSRGGITRIETAEGRRESQEDPLCLLREELGPLRAAHPALPFPGGAIGCFSYDLGRRLNGLPVEGDWPEMLVGLYDWALLLDHRARRAWLVGGDAALAEELCGLSQPPPAHFRVLGAVRQTPGRRAYAAAFARVQAYLQAGDCYQVNLARRLEASCAGDGWAAYQALREQAGAPFSAYLRYPDGEVMSLSPERFLAVRAGHVETRPIKGTRPRHADPARDAEAARALRASPKDRAENLMIVDLLRNDLGRVCETGSVRVPELFSLESYAQVHHLVSSVEGRLPAVAHALDLLRACLPGGSITGAPKRRAMEIIEELEPGPRGMYCGSVAYIGYDGAMDSSIAIRTALRQGERLRFWAGGGLVADSTCEAEFQETLDKARFFLETCKMLQS
ncbi:aminodeoxychorismate synthase component I [Alkalilimnicola sp. S0819]|uniref:aminodeoxychorismate synthase component I n=1 Tax=Alkalilimnicola sp. S0819 TaxID=2613922 RepID=UPI00126268EC|nr:aminodeoxychorismate synthase component I [Alkalilimnicola sp. S0819]KAB7628300.1 aminodeoxychorismate synthase component I [Alkalilimnicola sp. S0819]MPQ15198.1 aminodeoxychorismate synthase component I [Alkalilimnicola sp. S0819]